MIYTGYELLYIFFVYSFTGWIVETVVADIRYHKFVNRGFFNGPVCTVYGIAAVVMTSALWELKDRPFFLYMGCVMIAAAVQWGAGRALEKLKHHRWWDFSGRKWNIGGYICVQDSLIWGLLGAVSVKWINMIVLSLYALIPSLVMHIILWILSGIAVVDVLTSLAAVKRSTGNNETVRDINNRIVRITNRIGGWIASRIERHITVAYPAIDEEYSGVFAEGCGFYKLFMLFFIGAFLGDVVETIYCYLTAGVIMSRSSLVWGPFSLVWGFAMALATLFLYRDWDKPDRYIFIFGTFMGGTYEYICSVFTELIFGKVFWDYSHIPFNLGGRVNLLYCFFWGIAAVVWIKFLYPVLSSAIEKIPKKTGTIITWILVIFMTCNILVSMAALIRYDQRDKGIEPVAGWQYIIDEHFDDVRMQRIYPNAVSK